MENDPQDGEIVEGSRVVEAEVVGHERAAAPSWKNIFARMGFALVFGIAGLLLSGLGLILTLTIVGAAVGIPLLLVGLCLMAAASLLFLGGGKLKIRKL